MSLKFNPFTGNFDLVGDSSGGGGSGDMILAAAQTVTGAKTFNSGTFIDKGSQRFDVRAYGAVGNGTTDDQTAFQAAITAAQASGGTVFIPANFNMIVSGAPTVTSGNVVIEGAGWSSKITLASSALNALGTTIGIWVNGASNVIIRNLAIDGNFANIAKSGTYATASPLWDSTVSRYGSTSVKNYQYGAGGTVDMNTYLQYSSPIRISNATNVIVENCYVYNSKSSGILVDSTSVDGTQEIMIRNNRVRMTWDNGIYFHQGVRYASAIGNHCSDTQYAGIAAIYCNDITVSDNVIHDNGPSNSDSAGVEFCGVTRGIISDNTIYNSLFEGVLLKNTNETNLTGGASGKYVRNYNISVLDNKISTVHDPRFPSSIAYGVNIRSADNTFVQGNTVHRSDYGIAVGDVATGTIINSNHINKSYGWGMMLGNIADIVNTKITNNIIENGLSNGAVFYAPVIFKGNTVRNNAEQGIDLATPPSGLPFKTDYIENNYFADNGYNGINAGAGAGNLAVIKNNQFVNSDNLSFDDGSATASSATFTSTTASFTASDVGGVIIIPSVGDSTGANTLTTTVSAVTNSTTITLATNALLTRTGLSFTLFRPKNVYYDGVMTSGNTALASNTAKFTSADVGKTVILYANNGPNPSILGTFTVNTYTSPTVVQLNASPANDTGIMFVIKRNYGKQARAVYISNGSDIHYEGNRSFGQNTENYNNGSVSIRSVIKNNYDFGSNTSNLDPLVAPIYPLFNASFDRYIGDKDMVENIDASGGNKTVNLPDVGNVRSGKPFTIIKTDASANTVTVFTPQNIDGATTYVLSSQYSSVTVISNGSTYYTVTPKLPTAAVTLTGIQTITNKTFGAWTQTDATDITFGTTTGTKIGTATTQKLGFFNATPVVQQSAATELGTSLSNLGLRASGAYSLSTSGNVAFTGNVRLANANVTTTATLTTSSTTFQLANATSAAFTITLPTTTTAGYTFTIKKIDASANAITVKAGAAGTIDAANTYVLSAQYKYVTLISTTTSDGWYVVGNN